jgi:hypothetical protein
MADDEKELHPLLSDFKAKMSIFHSTEDDELSRILKASQKRIGQLTGSEDLTDPNTEELILERGRYAYNDQLEFFEANFRSDLLAASLENYQPDDVTTGDDENGETTV